MIWNGVFPAVTTKFTANDALDLALFGKNIDAQLDAGVNGIILGGTLGEGSTVSTAEKNELLAYSLEKVNNRVPVVMNIAEQVTKDAEFAARKAQDLGAKGLMLLPPMRYKADQRETLEYLKAVAGASDLPIMIYNNPVDYGIEVTIDMFEELLKIDTIQAVKESTRDVSNVTRLKNAFNNRLKILCGVDTLAMESLVMGADGWVAGLVCAFPRETVVIYELIQQNRLEEAREIYRWFLPLLELDINAKLVQNIKLAEEATGIGSAFVRPPRLPLTGEELSQVKRVITQGLASRPDLKKYC